MKPQVIALMMGSVDGRLKTSNWSAPGVGEKKTAAGWFEKIHDRLQGDAWLVGRTTMAEMLKGQPHPPAKMEPAPRPVHVADRNANSFAIALDTQGKLHWAKEDFKGEHFIALLGPDVPDSHLHELAADGVSYIVAEKAPVDLVAMFDVLAREFGIKKLIAEGGGHLIGSVLAAGLVDEFHLLVYPGVDGMQGTTAIVETGAAGLKDKVRFTLAGFEELEQGVIALRYSVANAR